MKIGHAIAAGIAIAVVNFAIACAAIAGTIWVVVWMLRYLGIIA